MDKRKKSVGILLLIGLLFVAIFSVVPIVTRKPAPTSSALYSDVHKLFRTTPPPGFILIEQKSVGRMLNKAPTGMNPLARWYFELRHPSIEHDIDTYIFSGSSTRITVTVFHDDNAMVAVEIKPSSSPCKEADDLKATMRSRFPDLPCD